MHKLLKKSFWLPVALIKKITQEAAKRKISQSAMMRHIIISWYNK